MKYRVLMSVQGSMEIEVEANTPEKAEEKAIRAYYNANFGPLKDIECELLRTEDENGNKC